MSATTRYWWVNIRDCGDLLYVRRFPINLKGAVYESYVRPAILYGAEASDLKERDMGTLYYCERQEDQ